MFVAGKGFCLHNPKLEEWGVGCISTPSHLASPKDWARRANPCILLNAYVNVIVSVARNHGFNIGYSLVYNYVTFAHHTRKSIKKLTLVPSVG